VLPGNKAISLGQARPTSPGKQHTHRRERSCAPKTSVRSSRTPLPLLPVSPHREV
jgi:hypothetical protein